MGAGGQGVSTVAVLAGLRRASPAARAGRGSCGIRDGADDKRVQAGATARACVCECWEGSRGSGPGDAEAALARPGPADAMLQGRGAAAEAALAAPERGSVQ